MTPKSALIWLECPACGTHTANAIYTPAGQHIKASCPRCGAYIKFVSHAKFTAREIEEIRAQSAEGKL